VRAPPADRVRSLGSSLLDQVLAETLDPAYAAAAADREATGPPGRRERTRGQVLVAAVLAVVGLLGTITYLESAAGAEGRERLRQALIADVDAQTARTAELSTQLEDLRVEVTRSRDRALASTVEGQRALEELGVAEQGAALVPVQGPGLVVTLANAEADTGSDPVGTPSEAEQLGLVQDRDLQLAVNALWAAGAEAVSINDQRLGPTTAIRFAGDAVLVGFQPVTSPYQVRAIGDEEALENGFLNSPEAAELADVSVVYGVVFLFARSDDLTMPADDGTELRWSSAVVPPTGTAPGTSSPGTPDRPGG